MTFLGMRQFCSKRLLCCNFILYTLPSESCKKENSGLFEKVLCGFCCATDLLEVWSQRAAERFFRVLLNRKAGAFCRPLIGECAYGHAATRRNGIGGNIHILSDLSRGGEEMKGSAIVPYIILPGRPEVGKVAGEPSYTGSFIAQAFSGILQRRGRNIKHRDICIAFFQQKIHKTAFATANIDYGNVFGKLKLRIRLSDVAGSDCVQLTWSLVLVA